MKIKMKCVRCNKETIFDSIDEFIKITEFACEFKDGVLDLNSFICGDCYNKKLDSLSTILKRVYYPNGANTF